VVLLVVVVQAQTQVHLAELEQLLQFKDQTVA
jgi:hypothetical protein